MDKMQQSLNIQGFYQKDGKLNSKLTTPALSSKKNTGRQESKTGQLSDRQHKQNNFVGNGLPIPS